MKRFFLLVPILASLPIAIAFAAPKPKVVVPPAAKAPVTTKAPAVAPAKPKVVAPPGPKVPQVKPPRIKPPIGPQGMDGEEGHTHDHDHGAPNADGTKPVDPVGDSLDYLWKQSDVAFHEGDYPTAIKIHRAIVTLDPTDTESFGVGAWLLWSLEQKAEARAFIEQGLKANPNDAEMWDVAGQHYDLEKSFDDAKNAYTKSIELNGDKTPELLRRRLAHAAQHAGDIQLSEQTWTELVRDYPNSPVNKNNLDRVKALRNKAVE